MLYGNAQADPASLTFVDVKDVAVAHVEALVRDDVAGKRFIVAGDAATHCGDLTMLAEETSKIYPEIVVSPVFYSGIIYNILWYVSLSEFEKAVQTVPVSFDNAASKSKDSGLGLEYRPLADTIRDTVDSMKKWVKVKEQKKGE